MPIEDCFTVEIPRKVAPDVGMGMLTPHKSRRKEVSARDGTLFERLHADETPDVQ